MHVPADQIRKVLTRCNAFAGMQPETLDQLVAACRYRTIAQGTYLWVSGEPSHNFVMIDSGLMRLTQSTPSEKSVVVELLGPGDCMGMLATFGNVPHPFSALALTDAHVFSVDSHTWRALAQKDPQLLQAAARVIVPRMLGACGFMAMMATGSVEVRLALALLRLDEINAREHGVGEPIQITRQSLADIAVTTVETSIRVTSKWQREGLIATRHRSIAILSRPRLQSIVTAFS
ncbi:MAG: Crp/Fnr family transcriptional regulator [Fimbriimonadaceae bacterium]|nr:Crp/Fnr family transcriptional regulator [Fimbriimonadaceae bacterium]